MSQIVTCACGQRFRAEDHLTGKRVKCPKCGGVLVVPQRAAEKEQAPGFSDWFDEALADAKKSAKPAPLPAPIRPTAEREVVSAALASVKREAADRYEELTELRRTRRLYLTLQFAFGLPGLILMSSPHRELNSFGYILLVVGFVYVAKFKGHSGVKGLWALVPCLGALIVLLLDDDLGQEIRAREKQVQAAAVAPPHDPLEKRLLRLAISAAIIVGATVLALLLAAPGK